MRSDHASGKMRAGALSAGTTRVHRQAIDSRSSRGGAYSRYITRECDKTSVSFKTWRVRPGGIKTMTDIAAAEEFLVMNARVLDRRRYERLFQGGNGRAVRDAVAAYRTDDGGFGHSLEPDGRDPAAQPGAVEKALHTLHEADAWDEQLVAGALDWLERNAPDAGGVTFVLPTIERWPHPPW